MVTKISNNDLSQAKAQGVAVLDFSATWCGPCRMAMKETEPVKKEYEGKDIVFLYLAAENLSLIHI